MVFYRKYRPQTIEELDTASIRQSLGAVLSSGKVPHALLFTGPRGLGKTSGARIVAKSVNCLNNDYGKWSMVNGKKEKTINHKPSAISQVEPCNKCVACVSITEGRNLDVLEIDAASNRGIDEIRDLREKIKLAPSSSLYKVYIIDEVHMLTTEAFNAILKTLEEPPSHAVFVLCTTEAHKLPATIISRCLRFDFKRATNEDIVRSLERIAKGEKMKIEKEVLGRIAQGSDGSFREAAKILEQAVFSQKPITKELIEHILGETQNLNPQDLLKFLAKKEAKEAVLEINRLTEAGENLPVYTEKILTLLHKILMVKVGIANEGVVDLANLWQKEEVVKLIELFSRASMEMKSTVVPQLPLELAVVEWCEEEKSDSTSAGPVSLYPHPTSSPSTSLGVRVLDGGPLQGEPSGRVPRSPPALNVNHRGSTQKRSQDTGDSPRDLVDSGFSQLWPQIIEATKEYDHTLAGVLRGCRPEAFDGKMLTIAASYKFHKDRLDEPKVRAVLDNALSQVFGGNVVSRCILSEKSKNVRKDGEKNV